MDKKVPKHRRIGSFGLNLQVSKKLLNWFLVAEAILPDEKLTLEMDSQIP